MAAPRRRWFSFSLRTLFVLAGVCAIAALYAMPLFSTWRIRENQRRLDAERTAKRRTPEQAKLEEAFLWVVRNSRHSHALNDWRATQADEAEDPDAIQFDQPEDSEAPQADWHWSGNKGAD